LSQAIQIAKLYDYEEYLESDFGKKEFSNHTNLEKTTLQDVTIELHKTLVAAKSYNFSVPVDWFWEQTESMNILSSSGQFPNVFMLTPTAQILYAASHAKLQHADKKAPLRWLYDLDRLIRFYASHLDWDLLLSQAKIFEWGSALDAAILETVNWFGTPVPEYVLASLSEVSDRSSKIVALKQIEPATYMLQKIQMLRLLKGSFRIRYLLTLIFPSPTYIRKRFELRTAWAVPFHYVVYWWHAIKGGFRSLIFFF
jgi:hypothetical protein